MVFMQEYKYLQITHLNFSQDCSGDTWLPSYSRCTTWNVVEWMYYLFPQTFHSQGPTAFTNSAVRTFFQVGSP